MDDLDLASSSYEAFEFNLAPTYLNEFTFLLGLLVILQSLCSFM